jgi:hypothetical protein
VVARDQYSFGIVLWECVTRMTPHEGIPHFQVVFQVGTQGLRPGSVSPPIPCLLSFWRVRGMWAIVDVASTPPLHRPPIRYAAPLGATDCRLLGGGPRRSAELRGDSRSTTEVLDDAAPRLLPPSLPYPVYPLPRFAHVHERACTPARYVLWWCCGVHFITMLFFLFYLLHRHFNVCATLARVIRLRSQTTQNEDALHAHTLSHT